jgi:hypothetical protein
MFGMLVIIFRADQIAGLGLELGLARDNAHSFFVSFESLSARGGRFSMATALIERQLALSI